MSGKLFALIVASLSAGCAVGMAVFGDAAAAGLFTALAVLFFGAFLDEELVAR